MPYVAPSTVAAGQTYTSAAHNVIVNDLIDHESRLLTAQNTQYPYRNVLVNGAMQIAQRGTSISGITAGVQQYNTADRWATNISANGTFTNAITADNPTGNGFANAFRVTATVSAVTAASSYAFVSQRLEGQTLQHLKKGTASAQQLTLQFWVKSSKTGTYVAELVDNNNTRAVSSSYTVSSANTWEQKTLTFPADTTGALTNDGNYSLAVNFWLAAGTTYTSGTLATAWGTTTNANRAVGQVNVADATNGYWQVTGVQLEPGSVASPYEFVLYSEELRRCQRYFCKSYNVDVFAGAATSAGMAQYNGSSDSGSFLTGHIFFPVTMRANPSTLAAYSNSGTSGQWTYQRSGAASTAAVTFTDVGMSGADAYLNTGAAWTVVLVYGHWTASAEL